MEDSYAGPVHRIKYGSVLDYLEAKYARDVMIEDYDERERVKEKKKVGERPQRGQGELLHGSMIRDCTRRLPVM